METGTPGGSKTDVDPMSASEATLGAKPTSLRPGTTGAGMSGERPRQTHGAAAGGATSLRPSSVGSSSGSPLSSALRATASESAMAEALIAEEAGRARGFAAIIATVTFCVGLMVPVLGGAALARWLCLGALALMCGASIVVWTVAREPRRYTWALHRTYSALLATCVLAVEYYIGYFSPVPVALTLGIYFIGQSRDRLSAVAIPAAIIGLYGLLAGLTAFGVLADRSLFPAHDATLDSKLFAVVAVSLVLLLTLKMAHVSRASVQQALQVSHKALLVVAEREAQLEEARQNLDRALKAAVGKPGRYTGAVAGDYELELVIGVGAMGEVYAGRHGDDSRRAAVKLLQAEAVQRDDLVTRFMREAEICRGLTSPHVVDVLEVGRMADGAPFMAMEYLRGEDLAGMLRRNNHLGLREASELASQMAEGLHSAHAAGIIHRDIKPHNVFQARNEAGGHTWKILDFGVSKLSDTEGSLTAHAVVGTPGYMAPEQARGQNVDHRCDLFSMAVVLYRTATGRPAFSGTNTPEILFEVVYRTPPRPGSLRAKLPEDLDLVLAIALAKHPDHRFQSARDLARAFTAATRGELPEELRVRGREVLEIYPWGQTIGDTISQA